ncbi:MAG: hypothetical protein CMO80_07910 [Verrucomicrobiales bacterium]|nr:hypothetical protein [Verrucomicrobiales bacterium]
MRQCIDAILEALTGFLAVFLGNLAGFGAGKELAGLARGRGINAGKAQPKEQYKKPGERRLGGATGLKKVRHSLKDEAVPNKGNF